MLINVDKLFTICLLFHFVFIYFHSTNFYLFLLRDLPRINSRTVDLDYLQKLPNDSVGNTYYKFLETNVSIIYKNTSNTVRC